MALLTQLAYIYYFLSIFFCCSDICLQQLSSVWCFLCTYISAEAYLEINGSLAKVASSSTKWKRSAKSGSLKCLLLIFMTFLFQFSLVFPGNFDSTKHIIYGVSSKFQFYPNVALSQFTRKFHICCSICWLKLWPGFYFLAVTCQDLMWIPILFLKKGSCVLVIHSCWLLDTMFNHLLRLTISIFYFIFYLFSPMFAV